MSELPVLYHGAGRYRRKSDSRWVKRFKCLRCKRHFSLASLNPCYKQKKRQLNYRIFREYCSGLSQRRMAKLFRLSRTTVARKIEFLALQAEQKLQEHNLSKPLAERVEFDDLETFEHTRCKPLSVLTAVEEKTRRILCFEVAQFSCKGRLAQISLKKYGPREDLRPQAREQFFSELKYLVPPSVVLKMDQNPHYPQVVRRHFPQASFEFYKGRRGSHTGQGELKEGGYDPLYSINHTHAMLRANINRLFRKTWCTTKLQAKLRGHLAMYAYFHNTQLLKAKGPAE